MINCAKTEEIRVNNKTDRPTTIENREIKRVTDFYYLESTVSEKGGATLDVSRRIQNARGAFAKLRKVWQSTLMNRDTKLNVFNACVESVLLYGSETWLITTELRRKIQTFINRCLRYT
jgi:hypothetical protein